MGANTLSWIAVGIGNMFVFMILWRVIKDWSDASDKITGREIDLRDEKIEKLEGKLDIIRRYTEGEWKDPCYLAIDYGDTGWEKDDTVVAVERLCIELNVHKTLMEEHDNVREFEERLTGVYEQI